MLKTQEILIWKNMIWYCKYCVILKVTVFFHPTNKHLKIRVIWGSILAPFWEPFGCNFGDFWCRKGRSDRKSWMFENVVFSILLVIEKLYFFYKILIEKRFSIMGRFLKNNPGDCQQHVVFRRRFGVNYEAYIKEEW